MANTQISLLVANEVLEAAEAQKNTEIRSRAWILNRWLYLGLVQELGLEAGDVVARKFGFGKYYQGKSTGNEVQDKKNRGDLGVGERAAAEAAFHVLPGAVFGGDREKVMELSESLEGMVESVRVPEPGFVNKTLLEEVAPTKKRKTAHEKKIASGVVRSTARDADSGFSEGTVLYGRPGVLPEGHIAPGQSVVIPKHAPLPKIGEKCPHGWANYLQCPECNPKAGK